MKFLYLSTAFLFLSVLVGRTSNANVTFEIKDSTAEYQVDHLAHTVKAVSKESRGKAACDENKSCQFLVAIPVKSFDSESSGRDQHMLEVTKAAINPMIVMKGKFELSAKEEFQTKINIEISFAGEQKKYENLELHFKKEGDFWFISGLWILKMTDFKIERPSLLLVPVKDEFQIRFSQKWQAI